MSYEFTYVSSIEELESEFKLCSREITELVLHWTGTFLDQNIGSEDVHSWHLDRGWSGCGYHYVCRRDGRIQRGRPISIQGAHAGNLGHNKYSIGFSFAAGYNCLSGTKNANNFISADSINVQQWIAARKFIQSFYNVWPGGQVVGHNQTDTSKTDPGFDVDEYIKNTFNKVNAQVFNRDKGPLSTAEIIAIKTQEAL